MAAQNPPSLVFAVVRQGGPWSLANAFLMPVRPGEGANLEEKSALELDRYWSKLAAMYGAGDVRAAYLSTYIKEEFTPGLGSYCVDSVGTLVTSTVEAIG